MKFESVNSRSVPMLLAALAGLCLSACGGSKSGRVEGKLYVVATTTMVAR